MYIRLWLLAQLDSELFPCNLCDQSGSQAQLRVLKDSSHILSPHLSIPQLTTVSAHIYSCMRFRARTMLGEHPYHDITYSLFSFPFTLLPTPYVYVMMHLCCRERNRVVLSENLLMLRCFSLVHVMLQRTKWSIVFKDQKAVNCWDAWLNILS